MRKARGSKPKIVKLREKLEIKNENFDIDKILDSIERKRNFNFYE
jgi:hypothetical protein